MDFTIFEPILALRDELLEHLNDLVRSTAEKAKGEPHENKQKEVAGLVRRVLKERGRVLAALAASKPGAVAKIQGIRQAESTPLPSVGAPPRSPARKKATAKKPESKKTATKKPAAKRKKTGAREG